MDVSKITPNIQNLIKNQQSAEQSVNGKAFDTYLSKAMDTWNSTNDLHKNAEKIGTDFILGKTDDIASVMIAQEKANVALQFTVKVRDNLLDAYNEIMRMQI